MYRRVYRWGMLREVLASLMAALLLAAAAAPCTALAAPGAEIGPAPSTDPCKPHKAVAPAIDCVQLACQSAIQPAPDGQVAPSPQYENAVFQQRAFVLSGRFDTPEPPVPKTSPAIRA